MNSETLVHKLIMNKVEQSELILPDFGHYEKKL
jgi:hypothetical protein